MFRRRQRQSEGRRPSTSGRFPSDMAEWLETLGRFEWAPQANPMPEVRVDKMYLLAQTDRDGFLRDLAALAVPMGGWTALGAKYLITDLLPIETDTSDFNAIALAAFEFLRGSGVPPNRLSVNDQNLWSRLNRSNEPWLAGSEPPADTLRPLSPGEERKVAEVLRADGHVNEILVRQDGTATFTAVIDGAYSETDTRSARTDWHSAASLHELYIRIGESQQVPPQWAALELEPYFPLPPMSI
jgi:hypothetical protein